jgi:hypothetical protein
MEHNNNTTHAQAMQAHVTACKASGLTVKAYCQQHEIKTSNYYYWQHKLQPQPAGKFIPITSPPVTAPMSIIFTNGTRICFENMPPADYVKNLVH